MEWWRAKCKGFPDPRLRQFSPGNCGLTGFREKLMVPRIGKELLACQRAKVGRFKLADFFVPRMGFLPVALV
jgi:hypothetical protein